MSVSDQYNIYKSIRNLLNSSISTKEISKITNISPTTVNELRNESRDIDKTSFQNAFSLYNMSIRHKLNEEYLIKERNKGYTPSVPLQIAFEKIVVSFEPLDLFAYGILKTTSSQNIFSNIDNGLQNLPITKSAFITKEGTVFDCEDFGYQFNVRYYGAGPSNFVRFLSEFSKLDTEKIREIVGTNSIVEYNFLNDTFSTYPSIISESAYSFYTLNNKLIVYLSAFDNYHTHFTSVFKERDLKLSDVASDVFKIQDLLIRNYNLPSQINSIAYIPNKKHISRSMSFKNSPDNDTYVKLLYNNYEIWIPYLISHEKSNIFDSQEMQSLINALGLKNGVTKVGSIKKAIQSFQSKDDIQTMYFDEKSNND